MRTPSAAEVLRVWELGSGKRGWYRALLLLAPAFPNATFGMLADLAVGSRNAYLLMLRERLFGATMSAVAPCPRCTEKNEISITTRDLLAQAAPTARFAAEETLRVETPDGVVACCLLSSRDLEAVASSPTTDVAQRVLVARALAETSSGPLSDESLAAVADAIVTADPLADIRLGISCASCALDSEMPFDIATFLWAEVETEAARLLDHVHKIASAYGWPEAVILTMSQARRREYLRRAV